MGQAGADPVPTTQAGGSAGRAAAAGHRLVEGGPAGWTGGQGGRISGLLPNHPALQGSLAAHSQRRSLACVANLALACTDILTRKSMTLDNTWICTRKQQRKRGVCTYYSGPPGRKWIVRRTWERRSPRPGEEARTHGEGSAQLQRCCRGRENDAACYCWGAIISTYDWTFCTRCAPKTAQASRPI